MVQISRIFRIFVSSTFSDMVAERNALQEKVFPKLRTLCASKGFQFQVIDLRWGVSQEAGLNQKAVSICMSEIERCQQATKRPNFLLLMGDRYGWQPLPETIPASEFEVIEQSIVAGKQDLLNQWYWRDDNAVPAQYTLQVRRGEYEKYEVWSRVETELRTAIRNALVAVDWSEQQLIKYTTAVTEQEIIEGIFNNPNPGDSAYCFFRNIQTVSDNADTSAFIEQDVEAQHKLQTLKGRLYQHVPDNIQEYDVSLSNKGISTDHIQQLCDDVEARLTKAILAEIDAFEIIEPEALEKQAHQEFMLERTQYFVGRSDTLESIHHYINSDNNTTLVLHGESGIGKSSVMAQAIQQTETYHPIYRFIGVTPASSNILGLLTSICEEIVERYNSDVRIPPLYDDLLDILRDVFALPTKEQPIVLFLDALDQLTASQSPENLRWLTKIRSQHVKIIISVIPDVYLDAVEKRQDIDFIELKPLSKDNATSLLELWLADSGRKLQLEQRHEVLNKFKQNGLAIYLKLAFEEARLWHSYTDSFELATEVLSLIRDNLFARLSSEKEHGKMLVECSMSYLAASRYGLTENEILELLALDDKYWKSFKKDAFHKPVGRQIPIVVWSRLELDLRPYMTERAEYGVTTYGFYHRQFTEVVDSIYLEPQRQLYHSHLALYFSKQELYVGDVPNARKVSELPYQQAQVNLKDEYVKTLSNYPFIEASLDVLGVEDLIQEYELLQGNDTTRIIKSGLELSAHVLAQNTYTLGLQLRGRLGYYDGEEITAFLESIPQNRVLEPMNKAWLNPADGALLRIFEGHSDYISGAMQLVDGNLLSWSKDSTLRLWHPNGTSIANLERHSQEVSGALQLQDGNLLSWSKDSTLRLWHPNGASIANLEGHSQEVSGALQLQDGNLLSWSKDSTLHLWHPNGTSIKLLRGHPGSVHGAIQLKNGRIVSWGDERRMIRVQGFICVWDDKGSLLSSFKELFGTIVGVKQLLKGKIVYWGSPNVGFTLSMKSILHILDADMDVKSIKTFTGHNGTVKGILELENNELISWSNDKTICIWQENGEHRIKFNGHNAGIIGVIRLGNGNLLSWSVDNTLRTWNISNRNKVVTNSWHTEQINGLMQLSNERFLSWSNDAKAKLWSAQGTLRLEFSEHRDLIIGALELRNQNIITWSSKLSGDDSVIKLWTKEGNILNTLQGHTNMVLGALQLENGHLLSWSSDGTLRLWDEGGFFVKGINMQGITVNGALELANLDILSWGSPNYTRYQGKSLQLWTLDGENLRELRGHNASILGALQLKNRHLLSWSSDGTLRLWDEDGNFISSLEGHSESIVGAYELANNTILSWSSDKTLQLWTLDGENLRELRGHSASILGALQLKNRHLLSWSGDGTLRLWDEDGNFISSLEGHSKSVVGAHEIKNSILSWSSDSTLRVWDINGQKTDVFHLDSPVYFAQINIYCNTIVLGDNKGRVVFVKYQPEYL